MIRDKYRIDAFLATGSMANVYAATHRNGNRVALKILHREHANDPSMSERFRREGYFANAIKHPGIIRAIDDDVTDDGCAFIVMELLDGENLEDRRRRRGGKLSLAEALDIGDTMLEILAAAHDHEVLHRDVKPDNVFITQNGEIKLLDFGVARFNDGRMESDMTAVGMVLGTPAFMPPEQALGRREEVDARSDIWGVGATLFTVIAGQPVHEGVDAKSQLIATARTPVRPLRDVAPETPRAIATVIDRALAFEKLERWPSAKAMREALRWARSNAVGARGPSEPPSAVPTRRTPEVDDDGWDEETLAGPSRNPVPSDGVVTSAPPVTRRDLQAAPITQRLPQEESGGRPRVKDAPAAERAIQPFVSADDLATTVNDGEARADRLARALLGLDESDQTTQNFRPANLQEPPPRPAAGMPPEPRDLRKESGRIPAQAALLHEAVRVQVETTRNPSEWPNAGDVGAVAARQATEATPMTELGRMPTAAAPMTELGRMPTAVAPMPELGRLPTAAPAMSDPGRMPTAAAPMPDVGRMELAAKPSIRTAVGLGVPTDTARTGAQATNASVSGSMPPAAHASTPPLHPSAPPMQHSMHQPPMHASGPPMSSPPMGSAELSQHTPDTPGPLLATIVPKRSGFLRIALPIAIGVIGGVASYFLVVRHRAVPAPSHPAATTEIASAAASASAPPSASIAASAAVAPSASIALAVPAPEVSSVAAAPTPPPKKKRPRPKATAAPTAAAPTGEAPPEPAPAPAPPPDPSE